LAVERHPYFWKESQDDSKPNIKITDADNFAREIAVQINCEDEHGSTLLTRMLHAAIQLAAEAAAKQATIDKG